MIKTQIEQNWNSNPDNFFTLYVSNDFEFINDGLPENIASETKFALVLPKGIDLFQLLVTIVSGAPFYYDFGKKQFNKKNFFTYVGHELTDAMLPFDRIIKVFPDEAIKIEKK